MDLEFDEKVWEKNVSAWRGRGDRGDRLPPVPDRRPDFRKVSFISGRYRSLQMPGETGRPVSLHSPKDPWKEAESLASGLAVTSSQPVVALGMGLGYHLLRLLPRLAPETRLIVVEAEPEVFLAALAALDLTPLLERPYTHFIVTPDSRAAIHRLQGLFRSGEGQTFRFFGHPPSLRARFRFYQEVVHGLEPCRPRRPGPWGVKKARLRVLVVNSDYFLIPEAVRAFRRLGHRVRSVLFDKRRDRGEEVVRRILREVEEYAPDLVFTVNHLGLDRKGLLVDLFHRLRLPLASWFVDRPAVILNLYEGRPSEFSYMFVWDPACIPEVRALGFEKVFPLPLATDPEIFCPCRNPGLAPGRHPVAFVGNSLVGAVQEKLARLPASPGFRRLFHRLARAYQKRPFWRLDEVLKQEGLAGHPLLQGLSPEERTDLEAGMMWEATRRHRLACIRRLAPFQPVVFGDPGWRRLLAAPFSLRPEVNYYEELPQVYRGSVINFNVTSLQMKTAVNQRVFDVPAAGGFLLTDFKAQLPELLEVGKEIICYRHPEEIPELARFYLKSDRAREEVICRGRERILAEHTYIHRLQAMVEVIRRTI